MIVDASVHVWDNDVARYPWSPLDGVDVPANAAPAAEMLADLGEAGVNAAVCVQPRSYGYDHTYLAAAIRDFPGRICGVCLVDSDNDNAPEKLTELVGAGFAGLRIIAVAGGKDGLAGHAIHPLLQRAGELGTSVSLLVDPDRFESVGIVATGHPSVTFIVDHLGLCTPTSPPDRSAALIALARIPNVSVRVSALTALSETGYPFADLHSLVRSVYRAFGANRILWGTDYPYVLDSSSYRQSLEAVEAHMPFIDPADLSAILGGNAARIYGLAA